MELFAFYCFAGLAVIAALFILFTRNLMYAAFALFLAFLGVAAMYVLAGADFLAVAQILVYVGGVLVLLVFGIMLTHSRKAVSNQAINYVEVENSGLTVGLLVAGLFFAVLHQAIFSADFRIDGPLRMTDSTIETLGIELMTSHLLPFEIAAIILLVTLLGAAHLAFYRKNSL